MSRPDRAPSAPPAGEPPRAAPRDPALPPPRVEVGPSPRRLAVVIVHYHAGPLLGRAVGALRDDLAASGLAADLVVVDNGSDADERAALAALPVRTVDAGGNRGYAGGLNLGIASAEADAYVLMNPDVEVRPGCLAALLAALRDGAAAAGPLFTWDRAGRLLLPPTEERTRASEIRARLATRGGFLERHARARWRGHARRHWLAPGPIRSRSLSGALLAVRRDTLLRVGPFDLGYRLYFEEDDWLRRLEAKGLAALYVPAARAVHLYAQSAAREPQAPGWFAASAERFQRRHYGRWFPPLLARLGGPGAPPGVPALDEPALAIPARAWGAAFPGPARGTEPGPWLEVSPTPVGFPAAAEPLREPVEEWRLPGGLAGQMAPGAYLFRVVSASGAELACARFDVGVP